jgi:hypothetical protein
MIHSHACILRVLDFCLRENGVFGVFFGDVTGLAKEKEKGQITIEQKKKKREIFEEGGHRVDVPSDVSEEEKKALEQTGEEATAGW